MKFYVKIKNISKKNITFVKIYQKKCAFSEANSSRNTKPARSSPRLDRRQPGRDRRTAGAQRRGKNHHVLHDRRADESRTRENLPQKTTGRVARRPTNRYAARRWAWVSGARLRSSAGWRRGQHPLRRSNDPFLEGVSGRASRRSSGVPLGEGAQKHGHPAFGRRAPPLYGRSPPRRGDQSGAFILLDEPFAGVDPIAVEDIQSIVATLKNRISASSSPTTASTDARNHRPRLPALRGQGAQNGFAGGAGRRPRSAQTLSGQALRTAPQPDDRPPAAAGRRSAALRFGNRCRSYARVARHAAARIHTTTE